ncbi:protein SERAC1 [Microdochium nivale]|nr:protein SERAC1 [Microdochium nivale]
MPPGLICLYDGAEKAKAKAVDESLPDIVAVHGLGEDSINAWTDSATGVNWLRDLLPKHVRVARVLVYGYEGTPSIFLCDGVGTVIQRAAEWLVQELYADRVICGRQRSPIIFVCHGLGGIIVKKSLAYASTKTAPKVGHLQDCFVSTHAIIFFATPHDRSSKSGWLAVQRGAESASLRKLWRGERSSRQHQQDIIDFRSITADFQPLSHLFSIFCFWEELPTMAGEENGYLVPRASATLDIGQAEMAGIHADHYQMIKFGSPTSSSYRTVVEALSRYATAASHTVRQRWSKLDATLHLNEEPGVHQYHSSFEFSTHDNHTEPTGMRVSNVNYYPPEEAAIDFVGREEMLARLQDVFFPNNRPNIEDCRKSFVVYGMGGSGKTQLCSTYAQRNKHRYSNVFTIHAASKETITESYCFVATVGKLEATERAGRHYLSQFTLPWLLIIDNADDPSVELKPLFPQSNTAHILITTRNPDFRQDGSLGAMESSGLTEIEALQLLLTKADIPQPWDPLTIESGNAISRTLGYLALALIHAGNCIFRKICKIGDYLSLHSVSRDNLRSRAVREMPQSEVDTVGRIYSTFEISMKYLQTHYPHSSQDINALLRIVSFYHFEHVPIEIFTRAVKHRRQDLESTQAITWSARAIQAITARLEPPRILPEFLKGEPRRMNHYRVTQAISALHSFSLVTFDGRLFSLHPLVHAWIKDSMSDSERAFWGTMASNTLFESLRLPPIGDPEKDRGFHRSILPHLDQCVRSRPEFPSGSTYGLSSTQLIVAKVFQPTLILMLRERILQSAKSGYVYATLGNFHAAVVHLQEVKNALVEVLGAQHDKTLSAMLALAGILWGLGRIDQAIVLQKTVVTIRTRTRGISHQETLQAMDHLGKSYWLHGQYGEALELQTSTVEMARKTLTSKHPLFLSALDNLGSTLGSWHRFQESEKAHRDVYEARREVLGESHLETVAALGNMAMAVMDQGRLEEASNLIAKVHYQRQEQLGKEHPWTLWTLCNLAKVYIKRGYYEEAQRMLVWGVGAGERSLGKGHVGVLMGLGELARVYSRQDRPLEAVSLTRHIVQQLEAGPGGPNHPDCVYALYKLARLFEIQQSPAKGAEACKLALERSRQRLPSHFPVVRKVEALVIRLERQALDV